MEGFGVASDLLRACSKPQFSIRRVYKLVNTVLWFAHKTTRSTDRGVGSDILLPSCVLTGNEKLCTLPLKGHRDCSQGSPYSRMEYSSIFSVFFRHLRCPLLAASDSCHHLVRNHMPSWASEAWEGIFLSGETS